MCPQGSAGVLSVLCSLIYAWDRSSNGRASSFYLEGCAIVARRSLHKIGIQFMHRIKKQQRLIYRTLLPNNTNLDVELKVICKERLGDLLVARCKVMSKNWYEKEIYITEQDLFSGKIRF